MLNQSSMRNWVTATILICFRSCGDYSMYQTCACLCELQGCSYKSSHFLYNSTWLLLLLSEVSAMPESRTVVLCHGVAEWSRCCHFSLPFQPSGKLHFICFFPKCFPRVLHKRRRFALQEKKFSQSRNCRKPWGMLEIWPKIALVQQNAGVWAQP